MRGMAVAPAPSTGLRDAVTDVARGLAATGVLLSAVVHLELFVEGFSGVSVIGVLFLLNFAGGVVLGALLLTWRHWLPALAAAGYGLVTVVAFWISVAWGLFGVHETAGGAMEVLAQVAEYMAIVFGLLAAVLLLRGRRGPAPTFG
jgi:hypothetical protein